MEYMMVLNDGETFTNLAGCGIVAVPDGSSIEVIEELLDSDDGSAQVGYFKTVDDTFAFVDERKGISWFVVSMLPNDHDRDNLFICRTWTADDYEHAMEQHVDAHPEETVVCASITEPMFYGSTAATDGRIIRY